MHKKTAGLVVTFAAVAVALPARAHDFWVQPLRFWIPPNSSVPTSLQVGHGQFRERWNAPATRVSRFWSLGPAGAADHLPTLRAGSMDEDRALAFGRPGTHVLVLETSHAESNLPGPRFTAYLEEEGLTPALELRERTRKQASLGREIYSRRAKALVQVGAAPNQPQPWVTRPVGLSLEIVPQVNPYAAAAGQMIPVQILYEGRPLAGALVKLNNLNFDGRPVAQVRTDRAGRATFQIPRVGSWQMNVIWTKPIRDRRAEFETTFSSLTFGFVGAPR